MRTDKINDNKIKKAFSLVEILIAIAVFTLIASSISFFAIDVFQANENARNRINASQSIQEITNALVLNKLDTWVSIINNSDQTPKHLEFIDNHYQIVNGTATLDGITISLTINPVYRDVDGNIVTTGGTLDSHAREVEITANWFDTLGKNRSLTSQLYVNDWYLLKWTQTTAAEFNLGTNDFTVVTNNTGGEVQLSELQAGSWQSPILLGSLDFPGNFTGGRTISQGDYVYSYEKIQSSNTSYLHIVNVSNKSVPTLAATLDFGLNQYIFHAIQVQGSYLYLLASNPSLNPGQVIMVLDISNISNPTIFNTYNPNPSYWTNPVDLIVRDGYCYVLTGGDTSLDDFLILNCQDPANISLRSVLNISNGNFDMTRMSINGDNIFVSSSSNSNELLVINISDKNNPNLSTSYNLPGNADALAVSSIGSYTYMTRENSSEYEFQILNSANLGNISLVSGYNTGNKTYDLFVDLENNFVFLANSNPQEQFVIVDIINIAAPVRYAGIQLTGAATGVTLEGFYAYLSSNSNSNEFQIVFGGRGGRGTGGGLGFYEVAGNYTSTIFDTNSTNPYYVFFNWTETLAPNTDLRIQLRTGATTAELESNQFVGPDGTITTYYTNNIESIFPSALQGKQYLQYRLYFTSDGELTSVINDITFYYQ